MPDLFEKEISKREQARRLWYNHGIRSYKEIAKLINCNAGTVWKFINSDLKHRHVHLCPDCGQDMKFDGKMGGGFWKCPCGKRLSRYQALTPEQKREERNRGKERREIEKRWRLNHLAELKKSPCCDCGNFFHPAAMDLDHVRGVKKYAIARAARTDYMARATFLAELEKCDLVCSNCHRVRTHNRLQAKKQNAPVCKDDEAAAGQIGASAA